MAPVMFGDIISAGFWLSARPYNTTEYSSDVTGKTSKMHWDYDLMTLQREAPINLREKTGTRGSHETSHTTYRDNKPPVGHRTPEMGCFRTSRTRDPFLKWTKQRSATLCCAHVSRVMYVSLYETLRLDRLMTIPSTTTTTILLVDQI